MQWKVGLHISAPSLGCRTFWVFSEQQSPVATFGWHLRCILCKFGQLTAASSFAGTCAYGTWEYLLQYAAGKSDASTHLEETKHNLLIWQSVSTSIYSQNYTSFGNCYVPHELASPAQMFTQLGCPDASTRKYITFLTILSIVPAASSPAARQRLAISFRRPCTSSRTVEEVLCCGESSISPEWTTKNNGYKRTRWFLSLACFLCQRLCDYGRSPAQGAVPGQMFVVQMGIFCFPNSKELLSRESWFRVFYVKSCFASVFDIIGSRWSRKLVSTHTQILSILLFFKASSISLCTFVSFSAFL